MNKTVLFAFLTTFLFGCQIFSITPEGARLVTEKSLAQGQNTYTCDYDVCQFIGVISSVPSTTSAASVIVRVTDPTALDNLFGGTGSKVCVAVDAYNKGQLDRYSTSTTLSGVACDGTSFTGSNEIGVIGNYRVAFRSGGSKVYVCKRGTAVAKELILTSTCTVDTSLEPKYSCDGIHEYCGQTVGYYAKATLTNPTDANLQSFETRTAGTYQTPKLLNRYSIDRGTTECARGTTVTFKAVDSRGASISNTYMQVFGYDTTCVTQGECKATDKYCTGQTIVCANPSHVLSTNSNYCCPTGYEFKTGTYCKYVDGGSLLQPQFKQNICYKITNSVSYCVTPSTASASNQYYKACDGQDSNGCFIAGTQKKCDGNWVCKPENGNVGQAGWGQCLCGNTVGCVDDKGNMYAVGEKFESVQGSGLCKTCNLIDGCPGWSTTDSQCCVTGLNWNQEQNKCECSQTGCVSGNKECSSDFKSIKTCQAKTYGTVTCYEWGAFTNCPDHQSCDYENNVGNCNCNDVKCTLGKFCENNYLKACLKDPNDCLYITEGTKKTQCCLDEVDCNDNDPKTEDTCNTNTNECSNIQNTAYCDATPQNACPTNRVCDMTTNTCSCPTTNEWCDQTTANSNTLKYRCKPGNINTLQICEADTTARPTCYKWRDIPCTSPKMCLKNDGTNIYECSCPTTGKYCLASESQKTRCSLNATGIETCSQSGSCYEWKWTSTCTEDKRCFI